MARNPTPAGILIGMNGLSDAEFRQMVDLLTRYGNEIDQWDMFQLPGEYGPIYVSIGLAPWPGSEDGHYRLLPAPGVG